MNSMTISVKDSIIFNLDSEYIQLNNNFIIESSLKIFSNDSLIEPKKVSPTDGKLFLEGIPENSLLIIEYDILKKHIPLIVGPKWKNLPTLDSLSIFNKTKQKIDINTNSNNKQTIHSSGSFFRTLSISPYGNSDLQGGIQMELNGTILEDIIISGVLTDQNFPIQEEGNTQALKDFDKVFIKVEHQNIELNAGDIDYIHYQREHTIQRKLEGLKNKFQYNQWSGSSVFANSKGEYHFIEIKGRDGDQGPYQLVGKNGNRDIAILSGTEKVWLNGERVKRGQNYDYTIDYSSSEIYFTPKRLIDFDTDIFVEYQYSDFNYQKGFRGITLKNNLGNSGNISFGIFDEFDQYNQIDFVNDIMNVFPYEDSLNLKQSTAVIDSNGDYVLLDSIFVYDPSDVFIDSLRYRVNFMLNPKGNYIRKISFDNKMYYQYSEDPPENLNTELFSPYRNIPAPTKQQFGEAYLNLQLNEALRVEYNLSASRFNQNILGIEKSSNALSSMVNVNLDTINFDFLKLKLEYKNHNRGKNYKPIGREQEIMQTRLWNLDKILFNNYIENYFKTHFIITKLGISTIEFAALDNEDDRNKRYRFTQKFSNKNYINSSVDLLYVDNSIENFQRTKVNIERNGSKISPNFLLAIEQDNFNHRFQKLVLV